MGEPNPKPPVFPAVPLEAPAPDPKPENPLLGAPNPDGGWVSEPKVGVLALAMLPNVVVLLVLPKPNPPLLAAAVPSPNTLPPVEPSGLANAGAEPNAGTPPNPGDPPNVGGLPNTGAAPKPPVLLGLENPNP